VQTPALDILDQALVDAAEGKNPWLIFTMSPQEGKSQRVSRNFPLWLLIHNPHLRVAVVSYADALARRWGRVVRNDLREHPELGLTIRADTGAANEWQIDGYDGGIITAGIGSGLTGRPVDVLIIDDPLKDQKEADSETIRQTCKDFWQTTASSRLSETSIVILVMTRWHEDDLAGWLMENHAQDFVHINIPAQAEHDPSIGEVDILGREPGEYMVSARARTHAGWEKRKRSAGSRGWNALYQGRPAPAEGGELKRHWWRRYPHHMRAVQRSDQTWHALGAGVVIMTIDCAFKDQESSDFVCFQIWASKGSRAWLLDQVCERLSFTETVSTLIALAAKWPQAKRRYIEDKANGPAVVSALRGKLGGIIEYTPVDSKLARVRSVSPFVEAGDVEIPEDASFTHAFVEQCAAFPNGANDDMVDCLSLALIKLLLDGLGNQFMDELLAEQNAQSPTDHVLRQLEGMASSLTPDGLPPTPSPRSFFHPLIGPPGAWQSGQ
jgi:predicted phage terminase large subunit-like protein